MADSHGFEVVEHTADVGIKAWGSSASELMTSAAEGLFSLIVTPGQTRKDFEKRIEVSASDWGGLLISWLDDLLYLSEVEGFLLYRVESIQAEPFFIKAIVSGETYDAERHSLQEGIKAVTFHGLHVQEAPTWSAQVIFDV